MSAEPRDLDAFFASMAAFLRGEIDPATLAARLGDSPSAAGRFDFYRHLIQANHRRVLGHLFPATRREIEADGRVGWAALVDEFAAAHPSPHWDLNAFGAPFSEFLEGHATLGDAPQLAALADYEFLYYETVRAEAPFDPAVDLQNPTAAARAYTHNVPQYVRALKKDAPIALVEAPITVLFYRRAEDLSVRFVQPTMPQLVAFAWIGDEAGQAECDAAGVSLDALLAGAEKLVRAGILGARAGAELRSRWRG